MPREWPKEIAKRQIKKISKYVVVFSLDLKLHGNDDAGMTWGSTVKDILESYRPGVIGACAERQRPGVKAGFMSH